MDLFLFTNFFPFKRSEPFLVNEFEFTKKHATTITILSLYGKQEESIIKDSSSIKVAGSVFSEVGNSTEILRRGIFNLSPFGFHATEFFTKRVFLSFKRFYWFLISLCITRSSLSSKGISRMVELIEKSDAPVLYFYWGDNLSWIIPYLRKRINNEKLKIVVRFHGSDIYENLKGNYSPLRKKIFMTADMLFTVSEFGKKYLDALYPSFSEKIKVSRLGIIDHGLGNEKKDGIFRVLSISNLVPLKRVHLIFEALQLLDFPVEWHHYGDGVLLPELKSKCESSRRNVRIHFHGFVRNEDLIKELKSNYFDVFVNVSSSEGLPVSIMEAFSFGIPAIATDVGGTAELVDETTGIIIPPDFNISDLSGELRNFYTLSDDQVKSKRESARKRFFSLSNAETNYTEFYTDLRKLISQ